VDGRTGRDQREALGGSERLAAIGTLQSDESTDKETLMLPSGLALLVFGAGLVLSNRTIRRYLGQVGPGNLLTAAVPESSAISSC
jgi:hypothetical protein